MMNLDSGNLTVYLSSVENITAFIGESAKIEVAQAINYIESGKAELRPLVLETKEYKQEAVSSASAALTSAVNAQNSANSAAESAVIAQTAMSGKQDTISDLATIRSGAALGTTAIQPSDLATVATSGSYNDLSNKPTIPTVNNPTITFTQGGTTKGTITLNQSSNQTIAFDAGGSDVEAFTAAEVQTIWESV